MGLTLTVDGHRRRRRRPGRGQPRRAAAAGRGGRGRPRPAAPACRWARCPASTPAHPCARPACRCRSRSARRCSAACSTGSAGPSTAARRWARASPTSTWPARRPHALSRTRVDQPLTFGVRALDTLVPCGQGQRLGIFAGSGVGKSSLLAADHPRHRRRRPRHRPDRRAWPRGARVPRGEPRPGGHGAHRRRRRHLRRAAAGAAARPPSSPPASPRRSATRAATCCCSWTRITRTAMAQREVGPVRGRAAGHPRLPAERLRDDAAAAGEGRHAAPPARSPGSTPCSSRATTTTSRSPTPPARSSTGTSCSTRKLATAGHFPAIDVLESISRVAAAVVPAAADGRRPRDPPAHGRAARRQGAHRDRRLPGRHRPAGRPRPRSSPRRSRRSCSSRWASRPRRPSRGPGCSGS